jgi:hypothetical protein
LIVETAGKLGGDSGDGACDTSVRASALGFAADATDRKNGSNCGCQLASNALL